MESSHLCHQCSNSALCAPAGTLFELEIMHSYRLRFLIFPPVSSSAPDICPGSYITWSYHISADDRGCLCLPGWLRTRLCNGSLPSRAVCCFPRGGEIPRLGPWEGDSKGNVPRLPPTGSCCSALGLRTADTDPELRGGVFVVPL